MNNHLTEDITSAQIIDLERRIRWSKDTIEHEQATIAQNQMILERCKKILAEQPEERAHIAELHRIAENVLQELHFCGHEDDDVYEIIGWVQRQLEKNR